MSDTDAIDSKKDKNNNEDNAEQDNTKKENNWSTFGYSCIFAIVLAIITWLMASNIVYFVRLPQEMLNKIFPKDPKKPPYAPPDDYVQTKKCTNSSKVKNKDNIEVSVWELLEKAKVIDSKAGPKSLGNVAMQAANSVINARPSANTALEMADLASGKPSAVKGLADSATNAALNTSAQALLDTQGKNKSNAASLQNMLGGGIIDDTMKKLKDTTSKYGLPYKWMYPYNDCAPDATNDTQSNFYIGKNSFIETEYKNNNSVYNNNGTIFDSNITDQQKNWSGATSTIATQLNNLIKVQKKAISEGKQAKATNMEEMETNLKELKSMYAYFQPSVISGKWWSQFGSNVANWIASSTQYSFITERRLLQFIFKKLRVIFGNNEKAQSNDLADEEKNSFAFGFFGMILSIVITYFITHFAMMAGAVVNAWGQISGTKYTDFSENDGFKKESNWGRGLKYSLIFGLMGFMNFMWSFGVGVVQYIEIIYKFIMYPIINNFDEWKNNITTTIQYLPLIYGILITMAAWTSLEPLYGNVMFITLIVYLFKQNKAHNDAIKKAKQN